MIELTHVKSSVSTHARTSNIRRLMSHLDDVGDDIVTNEGKPFATDFEGINVKLFPESETSKTAVRDVRGKFFVKCDQPPAPGRF